MKALMKMESQFDSHQREASPLYVLIIDDDDVDRERLRRMLRHAPRPLEIFEAASHAEALAIIRSHPASIDAVFLDFGLQDGDGRDLVPAIRDRIDPDCPIIAVTGNGDERVAADAIKSGMTEFLTKHRLTPDRVLASLDEGVAWSKYRKELRRAEEELTHRSLHDPLTDLPNRTLFFDRLEQDCARSKRNAEPFAVVMIDLDRFKEINDSLGHAAGDTVLITIAHRLRTHLREVDTVARLGGDEFALLLQNLSSPESAIQLGQKLIQLIEEPIAMGDRALHVGASMGIAMCPQLGLVANGLLCAADDAMYAAKRGIEKVVVSGGVEVGKVPPVERQSLLEDFAKALAEDKVEWHWQPQVDLSRGIVRGFEALVRWNHPVNGPVPADRLVEALEHSPMLETFTACCIDKVLRQFKQVHGHLGSAGIAINVSARMLESTRFADDVLAAVMKHGIKPERITLELTETALIANPAHTKLVTEKLHSLGLKLSIDDFGAGFTSFRYLSDFAINEIKIDRSFISQFIESRFDQSLVKSLVVLCENLDIALIAEGIETPEVEQLLLSFGCKCGQGYGIARPMPFEQILPWHQAWNDVQSLQRREIR